jgi:hypothetical protein
MFGKIHDYDLPWETRKNLSKLDDLINWPSISGFNKIEEWITSLAKHAAHKESKRQIDALELGCEVSAEEFNLLLDHLGLEIKDGKRIVAKKISKKGKK